MKEGLSRNEGGAKPLTTCTEYLNRVYFFKLVPTYQLLACSLDLKWWLVYWASEECCFNVHVHSTWIRSIWCFLDASKAFNRVNHRSLFSLLEKRNLPPAVLRFLWAWYKEHAVLCTVEWSTSSSYLSVFVRVGCYFRSYSLFTQMNFYSACLNWTLVVTLAITSWLTLLCGWHRSSCSISYFTKKYPYWICEICSRS